MAQQATPYDLVILKQGFIKVTLNEQELRHAVRIGVERGLSGIFNKRKPRYGCPPEQAWRYNIEGACGEKAVAKHYDKPWDGNLERLGEPDVALWQVRTVMMPLHSMLLHPDDKDHEKVLLVGGGYPPDYYILGWAFCGDFKYKCFWQATGRPCWFVPQGVIEPMTSFDSSE